MGKNSSGLDLGKFRFTNENLVRGAVKLTKDPKKVKFNWYLNRKRITTIKSGEWKIEFHFTLEMKPDFGEINLDGTCNAYSIDPRMGMFLANEFPPVMASINHLIRKECFKKCRILALKNKIPFPPVEYLMKQPQ